MTPSWFPDLESQHGIKLFMALTLPKPLSHILMLQVLPDRSSPALKWEEKG